MPTPDGITDRDWDKVHTLALQVVRASVSSDVSSAKALKGKLLSYLRRLEAKYGALPSILATCADYTEDNKSKEALLLRAYSLSKRQKDEINQAEIAHSLTELYVEDLRQYRKGVKWLTQLAVHVRKSKSRFLMRESIRFRAALKSIRGPKKE